MVRRRRPVGAMVFAGLVMILLYAPVVVTVLFSFTTSPRLSLPIEGLTLDWYGAALDNPLIASALRNTIILGLASALGAGTLGAAFAFGIVRLQSARARAGLLGVSLLPAVVPLLVIGIALAVFFRTLGAPQGLVNAGIGHVLVSLPFVILTMNARLETFDFSVLEAARDLGASPARTFLDVTWPLTRPAILGAALLAAALSLDEFVVTWFNVGNELTVPVLVWGLMRRGIDPSINALASLLLFAMLALLLGAHLVGRRRQG